MIETEKYALQLFEGNDNFDYKVLNENFRKIAEGTAPSGYGYGDYLYLEIKSGENFGDVIDALVADWSNLTTKQYIIGDANFHTYSILVDICKLSSDYIMVKGKTFDGYDVTRMCIHGVWEDWKWENPPMTLGVEYRTTERCNGATVYAKRIKVALDVIDAINGMVETVIPHNISGFSFLVRCNCVKNGYVLPYLKDNGGFTFIAIVDSANIAIRTYKAEWSVSYWEIDLYYTKS